ncbi:MAG TPA: PQQ-binding-like beta-propeller repeat protein, partial [Gemmatimonadaceae bacterium]|nr:PQQ-binding-like beta-propeller repeat protein [Gemmatimonadaceae bacterium]
MSPRISRTIACVLCGVVLLACRSGSEPERSTDQVLWRVTNAESVPVNPAFDGGTVYFGSGTHEVIAVDGRTGTVRWRHATELTGGQTAGFNVVVAADVVAMGDIDVYAFDRRTGAPRWRFQAADLDETGTRSLAADAQTIYAASLRGRVYALDARTGQPRWVTDLAQGDTATASFDPIVADGVVYVGTKAFSSHATGRFVALDVATGSIRWAYNFTPEHAGQYAGCFGGAVVWGQLVIVGQEDGRIFAFDRATGSVVWTAPSVRLPTMEGGTPW